MVILGIHVGHDSSAALYMNHNLIGAVQEERFSRLKNHSGFPRQSVDYLLKEAKLSPGQVDVIAIPGRNLGLELPIDQLRWRFGLKSSRLVYHLKLVFVGLFNIEVLRKTIFNQVLTETLIRNEIDNLGFVNATVTYVDHHECHAASAFFSSPFDSALIITQDGKGDGTSGSIYSGEGRKIVELQRQSCENSIGQIYAEVTRFLGFKPNKHEGKVTGLAAYGDPKVCSDQLRELVQSSEPKIVRLNLGRHFCLPLSIRSLIDLIYALANHEISSTYEINSLKLRGWFRKRLSKFSREDISAAVQAVSEDWITSNCQAALRQYSGGNPINVCLAGGFFSNVKINQRIRENVDLTKNIFVQPAMGDSGLALGAAQIIVNRVASDDFLFQPMKHAYLGPEYTKKQIKEVLEEFSLAVSFYEPGDIEEAIAGFLVQNQIVGRINGRTEWGPRALGNRSILISPSDYSINDTVNKRLNRSEFMPFAPSVLDYRAKDYFKNFDDEHYASMFMTMTYDVYPDMIDEIKAVVHVDGTARPQVVRACDNLSYYKILQHFEQLTGIGCIVNTSFNLHEEPIVNSPIDGIKGLLANAVDVLAIGPFIVTKK